MAAMLDSFRPVVQLPWTFITAIGAVAWLTHIVACLLAGKWVLLLVGGVVFPIGILHGIGIWLEVVLI